MIRIAILDLYQGQANQGMRCIRELVNQWGEHLHLEVEKDEFDVRSKNEVPDRSYDIYISSGGPGSPLESGEPWEEDYFDWLQSVESWNSDSANPQKKYVLFICHSFQLACRYYRIGELAKRKSTSFGVFPVHVVPYGQVDPVFKGLKDPFFVVDSREWQVIHPDIDQLHARGMKILCIEKYRPHVPYVQAVMGIRFNDHMLGVQFHPEADAIGMRMYLQTDEKKQIVVEQHGEAKWRSMIEHLNDPDKIMWTYQHLVPNFLNEAHRHLKETVVSI